MRKQSFATPQHRFAGERPLRNVEEPLRNGEPMQLSAERVQLRGEALPLKNLRGFQILLGLFE